MRSARRFQNRLGTRIHCYCRNVAYRVYFLLGIAVILNIFVIYLLNEESFAEIDRMPEQKLSASKFKSPKTETSTGMKKNKRENLGDDTHATLQTIIDCREHRSTFCSLNGVNYTCVSVPGSLQSERSDLAPSEDCLSGEYSWEVCRGGQFLCRDSPARLRHGLRIKPTISANKFVSPNTAASGNISNINVPKELKVYNLNIHPQQQRQWELVLSRGGMILTENREEAHVLIGNPDDRHACRDEGFPIVYGGSMYNGVPQRRAMVQKDMISPSHPGFDRIPDLARDGKSFSPWHFTNCKYWITKKESEVQMLNT